jgi:hypothetical protein
VYGVFVMYVMYVMYVVCAMCDIWCVCVCNVMIVIYDMYICM